MNTITKHTRLIRAQIRPAPGYSRGLNRNQGVDDICLFQAQIDLQRASPVFKSETGQVNILQLPNPTLLTCSSGCADHHVCIRRITNAAHKLLNRRDCVEVEFQILVGVRRTLYFRLGDANQPDHPTMCFMVIPSPYMVPYVWLRITLVFTHVDWECMLQ